MPPKVRVFPFTAALLAVLLVNVSARCSQPAAHCAACGRTECANLTTTVVRSDGATESTCCPRCAAHLLMRQPDPVSVILRDFNSAQPIPAAEAVLVEGGDVHPCRGLSTEPPRDAHGCGLSPAYDRCEPSLIAFRDADAAQRFISVHGGTPTRWDRVVTPSVPFAPAP